MFKTICFCNQVSKAEISKAIKKHRITNVEEVGKATGAGTCCGKCKPSIAQLIPQTRPTDLQLTINWDQHPDA